MRSIFESMKNTIKHLEVVHDIFVMREILETKKNQIIIFISKTKKN